PIERTGGGGSDGGVADALEDLARSAEQAAGPVGSVRGARARSRERSCVPAPSTTVRVATYNILGAGSRSGRGYDLGRVRADIASWDVDVAILQEVYRLGGDAARSDQPADLAAGLGMDWAFGYNARKGARTQYGTAVLSRFPIVEQANSRLPNSGGLEQRGLLRATLDVGGTRLDVFDTHLQHTPQAAALRAQQARSVAGIIGARRAATGNPAVLGGDFNSSPTGAVGASLNGVLRDTWFDVGGGQGATHPAGRGKARIDRLYQSADVVPLAAAVRPSAASDHDAVTAVYQLPGAGRVCE
ncbi:endonuclease/exonuclease/phosphatase family protein, partial [Nocardioides aquaticus]